MSEPRPGGSHQDSSPTSQLELSVYETPPHHDTSSSTSTSSSDDSLQIFPLHLPSVRQLAFEDRLNQLLEQHDDSPEDERHSSSFPSSLPNSPSLLRNLFSSPQRSLSHSDNLHAVVPPVAAHALLPLPPINLPFVPLPIPNIMAPDPDPPKAKEVTPPTLADVDPIKWVTFSKQFRRVSALNQWSATRAKLLLHTCMQDAAARAVEHIEFADTTTLDEALDLFATIFVNPASTQLYKTKFKDASRNPGEELILWHTRVREMFMRAYPHIGNQEEHEDLKERFVLGLRNRQLSHTLLSAENYPSLTFTQLLTRAQNLQGSILQCQKIYSDVSALHPNPPSHVASLGAGQSSSSRPRRNNGGVTCFHCDRPGHVINECRSFEKARARIAKNPQHYMSPLKPSTASSSPNRGQSHRGRGYSRGATRSRGNRGNFRGHRHSNTSGGRTASSGGLYPAGLAALTLDNDLAAALTQDDASRDESPDEPDAAPSFSPPVFPEN